MAAFIVIVPIYNAQRTLEKCLESLRRQTEGDFQVLMIENGSSDRSGEICRAFAAEDERFVPVQMPVNCGPSGARNAGLDRAMGEWVAFVDSDDHVEPEFLECLSRGFRETGADVLFYGYRQYDMEGNPLGERVPNHAWGDGPELWTALHSRDLFGYTWVKAFRREAIGEKRFSTELNLLEDEVFACEVLAGGCKCAVVEKPLYNYITGNAGSLVGRTHPDYCRKVDLAYRAWKKLLAGWPGAESYLTNQANGHVSRCMYYGFERDVVVKVFFAQLADSCYFRESTISDAFTRCVKGRRYCSLFAMRLFHRLRDRVHMFQKRQ